MKCLAGTLKFISLILVTGFVLVLPFSVNAQTWDTITNQFIPDDYIDRPPQAAQSDEFEDLVFTKENFYDKSAGMLQHRQTIREPKKSLNFEVYNPVDDTEAVAEKHSPKTQSGVVSKNGKPVTIITIKKDPDSKSSNESESQ